MAGKTIARSVFTMLLPSLGWADMVTNPPKTDGFGAQYQSIIYSMIFAELHGDAFVYSPLRSMEHNYDEDPLFLEKKEELINLRGHVPTLDSTSEQKVRSLEDKEWLGWVEANMVWVPKTIALQRLQKLFRQNKRRSDYLEPGRFHIAMHIRRPNPHDCRLYGSHVPDAFFQAALCWLRQQYADRQPLLHIFSQGDEDHFRAQYAASDVVLHIDEPLEMTFPQMVLADVLVLSPSSLSWAAGLLSKGTVYYQPFWHKPLPSWRRLPSFNQPQLAIPMTRDVF